MPSSSFAFFFAQVTNAATDAAAADPSASSGPPIWTNVIFFALIAGMVYFLMLRPQMQASKKKEETLKSAKTGDKVVTSSGIHGVITNVKDSTVIVKVADNVKLEIEKSHIDKVVRPESGSATPEKIAAKVS